MIDNKPTDVQKKDYKPNAAMHFIVALFSLFLGMLMKSYFIKWCEKSGLNQKEGFIGLIIVLWVIGVAIMLLTYLGYLLSFLF